MRVLIAVLLVLVSLQPSFAQDRDWIPQDLKAWQGWVLHGAETANCPALMGDALRRQCLFPTRLTLAVDASGAVFSQTWRVFAAQNVPLPSAPGLWPVEVKLGGKDAAVLDDNGAPVLRLTPGEYQVLGKLAWKRRPQAVSIPAQTGLIALTVDGKAVPNPKLTPDGRLELAPSAEEKAPEEALRVRVFRLLRDGLPFTVTTLVRLEVSGRARTLTLDGVLPAGTQPMGVTSPVPVGFGPDGQVLVQAGAGRLMLEITTRSPGPVAAAGPAAAPFGREISELRPGRPAARRASRRNAAGRPPDHGSAPGLAGIPGLCGRGGRAPSPWKKSAGANPPRFPTRSLPGASCGSISTARASPPATISPGASGRAGPWPWLRPASLAG